MVNDQVPGNIRGVALERGYLGIRGLWFGYWGAE